MLVVEQFSESFDHARLLKGLEKDSLCSAASVCDTMGMRHSSYWSSLCCEPCGEGARFFLDSCRGIGPALLQPSDKRAPALYSCTPSTLCIPCRKRR